ncbi:MAG: ACT domain-containing protein, partial [Candidatus Puniceispirillaceae bacterium]
HAQPQSPATVQPCLVAKTGQLAQIGGALNAVEFTAEPVQTVLCIGPGAGAGPTASAVLADVIDVAASRGGLPFGMRVGQLTQATQKKDKQSRRYYLRLMVMDETGVLSAVTSILRDQQISVESMLQKGQSDDKPVALVLTTHPTAPDQIKAACSSLSSASFISGAVMALPIVDEA